MDVSSFVPIHLGIVLREGDQEKGRVLPCVVVEAYSAGELSWTVRRRTFPMRSSRGWSSSVWGAGWWGTSSRWPHVMRMWQWPSRGTHRGRRMHWLHRWANRRRSIRWRIRMKRDWPEATIVMMRRGHRPLARRGPPGGGLEFGSGPWCGCIIPGPGH